MSGISNSFITKPLTACILIAAFVSCAMLSLPKQGIPDVPPEIPLVNETIKIWTVGDSITEGTNNGYRNRIWQTLTEAGNVVDFIGTKGHPWPHTEICPDADHDGYPNYTIGNIAGIIDDIYTQISNENPDILLIMLGTNDLAWWVGSEESVNNKDEEMMDLINHILYDLDSSMSIIAATIPPMPAKAIDDTDVDREIYGQRYSQALAASIQDHPLYGSRLFLVDMHSEMALSDLGGGDDVHPSVGGYDRMGDIWMYGIAEYLAVDTN